MNGKRKNWYIEPDQIKNTGFSKDIDKKMKRQATAWEKYLQNTHMIKNCTGHQHFCSQVQIFWTSQVLCRLYDDGGGLWKYFTWDIWLDVMPVEETGRTRRRKGFFLLVSQSPAGSRGSCTGLLQGMSFSVAWLLQRASSLRSFSKSVTPIRHRLWTTSSSISQVTL